MDRLCHGISGHGCSEFARNRFSSATLCCIPIIRLADFLMTEVVYQTEIVIPSGKTINTIKHDDCRIEPAPIRKLDRYRTISGPRFLVEKSFTDGKK